MAGHDSGSACKEMQVEARQKARSCSPTTVLLGAEAPCSAAGLDGAAAPQPDPLFQAPQWGPGHCRDATACTAVPEACRKSARQRNKIRNRFRSGVFRRCANYSLACMPATRFSVAMMHSSSCC